MASSSSAVSNMGGSAVGVAPIDGSESKRRRLNKGSEVAVISKPIPTPPLDSESITITGLTPNSDLFCKCDDSNQLQNLKQIMKNAKQTVQTKFLQYIKLYEQLKDISDFSNLKIGIVGGGARAKDYVHSLTEKLGVKAANITIVDSEMVRHTRDIPEPREGEDRLFYDAFQQRKPIEKSKFTAWESSGITPTMGFSEKQDMLLFPVPGHIIPGSVRTFQDKVKQDGVLGLEKPIHGGSAHASNPVTELIATEKKLNSRGVVSYGMFQRLLDPNHMVIKEALQQLHKQYPDGKVEIQADDGDPAKLMIDSLITAGPNPRKQMNETTGHPDSTSTDLASVVTKSPFKIIQNESSIEHYEIERAEVAAHITKVTADGKVFAKKDNYRLRDLYFSAESVTVNGGTIGRRLVAADWSGAWDDATTNELRQMLIKIMLSNVTGDQKAEIYESFSDVLKLDMSNGAKLVPIDQLPNIEESCKIMDQTYTPIAKYQSVDIRPLATKFRK